MKALATLLLITAAAWSQTRIPAAQIRPSRLSVRPTGSAVYIGEDCTTARPCNTRFGGVVYSHVLNSSRVYAPAGSGTLKLGVNRQGLLSGWYDFTGLQCDAVMCQRATAPDDAALVAICYVTAGVFGSTCTDMRADGQRDLIDIGSGLTQAGGVVSVDSAVIGYRVGVPATSGVACTAGSWAADAGYFYVCGPAGWRRAALSTW